MSQLTALRADLDGLTLIDKPHILRQKSRDFFWYSPVLKRQLDGLLGDLLVVPKDTGEVITALRACFKHKIPVTVRGAGTGNYGQAMPLKGGVILDMGEMRKVRSIGPGRVTAEPGIRLLELDNITRADSGQELRFHPSTHKLATLGGFVAGGSSGVGSITWGLLGDAGNVLGVKVVTMEDDPRVLNLRGGAVQKVAHAYGTNGVIVEVEMPLAPAYEWREYVVAFPDFMDACQYAHELSAMSGILKKLVSPIAAPVPQQYFREMQPFLREGQHLVLVMIAPQSVEAFLELTEDHGGEILYERGQDDKGMPPLYEFTWNHTTLQALKIDRSVTYLQSLFPPPDHLTLVEDMYNHFGDEVPIHLEFVRFNGEIACFGLQLVRFTDEERLAEIIEFHEANGVAVFNPHAYTVEEGGMKQIDHEQLNFKREADPEGLLNPGKMLGWDHPEYNGRRDVTIF